MSKFKKKCPVPFDQQPLNEYFSLKDSLLFANSTCDINIYIIFLIRTFVILFFLLFPLIYFFSYGVLFKIILTDCLIVQLLLICLCVRLYLGWSYVMKRLLSATIFYEESGWYDGQIWIKESESLTQDRLIGLYQVLPSIKKAQYSFVVLFISLVFNLFFYFLF